MAENSSSNETPAAHSAVTPDVTASPDAAVNASKPLFTKEDVNGYIQIGIAAAVQKLEQDYELRLAALNTRLTSVEAENQELKERLDSAQMDCQLAKQQALERFEKMERLLQEAGTRYKRQEKEINDLEQYSRRSHLRIRGLIMQPGETYKGAVARLCTTQLGVRIQEQDLDDAHPLPTKAPSTVPNQLANESPPPPPKPMMIVRFHCRHQRDAVLKARAALKGKGIVIAEDLTKRNQDLLRNLHATGKFTSTWSWMGKIYAIARGEKKSVRYDIHDAIPN